MRYARSGDRMGLVAAEIFWRSYENLVKSEFGGLTEFRGELGRARMGISQLQRHSGFGLIRRCPKTQRESALMIKSRFVPTIAVWNLNFPICDRGKSAWLETKSRTADTPACREVILGRLAQLVRAPRLHRGGRGFESLSAHPRITK